MKIYLDNCCFNRPFDDQSQMRIKLEAEAKLKIQEEIRVGKVKLVWSYMLDYENEKNPFQERKTQIKEWKKLSISHILENAEITETAEQMEKKEFRKFDALHIACAIHANCKYFLTTDDKVLKKNDRIEKIEIIDPFGLLKELEL